MLTFGADLKLEVKVDGRFGTCIKLQRGKRFFARSVAQWLLFRSHVPLFSTKDYTVKLSERKQVANRELELNKTCYVSFSQIYMKEGRPLTSYINFKPFEWQEFIAQLHIMDSIFPPSVLKPCPDCPANIIFAEVDAASGRLKETRLSAEQLQAVHDNNDIAYNQLVHCCTYCGGSDMSYDESCHCHRYDCRECESENFCKTCGKCRIFAI